MKFIATFSSLFCMFLLLCAGLAHAENLLLTDHPLAGKIWDMNNHTFIDESALIVEIKSADVLLLGETHDNSMHHDIQQTLFKSFVDSVGSAKLKPALMMEQLDAATQPALDQALVGGNRDEVLNRVTEMIKFTDWIYYRPLLAIAIDSKLPVIAANVSNRDLQPVIWSGFIAYDQDELKRLMVEEVWSQKRQSYLITHMGGAHCGQLRDELRAGLTRSQRLRDALMADSALHDISQRVVAIVGSSHARRDIGLPLYFAARVPSARIFSIGFIEVSPTVTDPKSYEVDSATGEVPYDVVWFTPRAERADPCANFGKSEENIP